jgi:hypothetical protein
MTNSLRAAVGLLLVGLWMALGIALLRFGVYGWTLFVLLPFVVGGMTAWVTRPVMGWSAARRGAGAVLAATLVLSVVRMEGLVCILMALPLALPLGALGALVVYRATARGAAGRVVPMLLLLPPASLSWDVRATAEVYEVRSAVTVAATPEVVWKHVVRFPDLAAPKEWYFQAGLAYPLRARIEGEGPGAVRYCEFSTGPFVEPIEVWDEPRLLAFRVTQSPPPMREWSPYGELDAAHLHGYMVSKRGQFRLTRLENGHTLLEGTTWYQHGLWPGGYWRLWSDAIIHRIHLRVLEHVRELAEKEK